MDLDVHFFSKNLGCFLVEIMAKIPAYPRLHCYFGCDEGGPLHHFPKPHNNPERFAAWKSVLCEETREQGDKYIYNTFKLCNKHFEKYYVLESKQLTRNSVPTLNLEFNTQANSELNLLQHIVEASYRTRHPKPATSTCNFLQNTSSFSQKNKSMPGMAEVNVISTKSQILEILSELNVDDLQTIEKWICSGSYKEDLQKLKTLRDLEKPLMKISTTLKPMIPFKAEMPTETINPPEVGDQADCNEVNTLHIDEFLYDEKDVEKLIKKGKIKKYYCKDCGSRNSEELIFTSHSMSRKALQYIFKVLLPADLKGKQILDVGSRLGAVLYGAYYCSNASKIIGVEINKEFCDIQEKIIKQFSMDKNRIFVEHSDVTNVENLIKTTDVLVINVLDFFVDIQKHIEIWRFMRKHLKKGAHLVANRSMVDTFNYLDIFEEFIDWLTICKPYQIDNELLFDVEEYSEIYLYTIK